MVRYANGYVPANVLQVIGKGTNSDGYWEHRLPAATVARHRELVRIGETRHGKTLQITPGWNCDRPYPVQVQARERYGNYAATPGTSSHGGNWAGPVTSWKRVDTAAIDYNNWSTVFGSRTAFFAACREVGLVPGAISAPAFPDEPHHVIDLDPWGAVPAFEQAKPLEIDMPLNNDDLVAILNASFVNGTLPDGKPRFTSVASALKAVYFYGDKIHAQNEALMAAVKALATTQGADPEAIVAVVDVAVREALDGMTITLGTLE